MKLLSPLLSRFRKEPAKVAVVDSKEDADPLEWLDVTPGATIEGGLGPKLDFKAARPFATAPDSPLAKIGDSAAKKELVKAMDESFGYYGSPYAGTIVPENVISWYTAAGAFPGYATLAIMAQHWLIDKCCSLPGEDAARNGYELSLPNHEGDPKETTKKLAAWDKHLKIKDHLMQASRFTNIFGVRLCIFVVESADQDYYEKPFNIDGVTEGSYKGISQVDPQWIMPQLTNRTATDPSSQDFYDPTYWIIAGKKYHKSHLIILRGPEPPDILKPTYIFGGISLTQRLWEHVYDAERTAAETPRLALAKRTTTLKADTTKIALKQKDFEIKLGWWTRLRDNFSVKVIGKDEELSESDTSLTDLDDVTLFQYQIVSSISRIPILKLMGTSPQGFSSGADELVNYHECLESVQLTQFDPILNRHYMLLTKSVLGRVMAVDVSWHPVSSASAEKQSIIEKNKALSGIGYINSGVLWEDEVRDRLRLDKRSGYSLAADRPAPGLDRVQGAGGEAKPLPGNQGAPSSNKMAQPKGLGGHPDDWRTGNDA